jgi:hypothetical protein
MLSSTILSASASVSRLNLSGTWLLEELKTQRRRIFIMQTIRRIEEKRKRMKEAD